MEAVGEVMRELSADDSLRCVVLRGAGEKSFAPGNDTPNSPTRAPTPRRQGIRRGAS